jgi:hypothetical protein
MRTSCIIVIVQSDKHLQTGVTLLRLLHFVNALLPVHQQYSIEQLLQTKQVETCFRANGMVSNNGFTQAAKGT